MYNLMVDEEDDKQVMKKISESNISLRELEEILDDGYVQSYYHDEIYRYRFSEHLGQYIQTLIDNHHEQALKRRLTMISELCLKETDHVDGDVYRVLSSNDVARVLKEFPESTFEIDLESIDSMGDLAYYISNNTVPYLVTLCLS